jgi:hypothetical protein
VALPVKRLRAIVPVGSWNGNSGKIKFLLTARVITVSNSEPDPDSETQPIDWEERVITVLLTVGMPFLIGFIAFGVIILAFSQWKLY